LEYPYSGPHRIIERISDQVFKLEVDGKETNQCQLKPAYFVAPQEEHFSTPKSDAINSSASPVQLNNTFGNS